MAAVPAAPASLRGLTQLLSALLGAEALRRGAQALPRDRSREADCSETDDATGCNRCRLGDGQLLPARPRRAVRRQNKFNYDYQLHIANLHAGPERFAYCDGDSGAPLGDFDFGIAASIGRIFSGAPAPTPERLNLLEWLYNGVWFDGYWRERCTVVDAKGRYAQFLGEDDKPLPGFPQQMVFPELLKEAARQAQAIAPARPQARLEWHFLQYPAYAWAVENVPALVTCVHSPWQPVTQA